MESKSNEQNNKEKEKVKKPVEELSLKNLSEDEDTQFGQLVALWGNGNIQISDIETNIQKINVEALNMLAVALDNGDQKLIKNKGAAINLYQIAAQLGSLWAKHNFALLAPDDQQRKEFEKLNKDLAKVKNPDSVDGFYYIAGHTNYELGHYVAARKHFEKYCALPDSKKNSDCEKEAKDFLKELSPDALLKKILFNATPPPPIILKAPWINLTEDFDGYDDTDEQEIGEGVSTLAVSEETGSSPATTNKKVYESGERLPELKTHDRLVQTEKHFFSPERTRSKTTSEIATKLQKNRLETDQSKLTEIDVTNISTRKMIVAEAAVLKASLQYNGRGADKSNTPLQWGGKEETMTIKKSKVKYYHQPKNHSNHLGNYHMDEIGTYDAICGALIRIAGSTPQQPNIENEKKMAAWMLEYMKNGTPVTLEKLREIRGIATQNDADTLARIFYHCFVKEIARWMMPRDQTHELPFAIVQARAVKLISLGFLNLKDVFDQDADYGVFTLRPYEKKDVPCKIGIGADIDQSDSKTLKKIPRINKLYNSCVLEVKPTSAKHYAAFFEEHPKGSLVITRQALHTELKEHFGGIDSDSDGEGYDSDTANELYPGAFEFK